MKYLYFTRSNGDIDCLPEKSVIRYKLTTVAKRKTFIGDSGAVNFSFQEQVIKAVWDGSKYVSDTAKIKEEQEVKDKADLKLSGIEFEGVMCSAKSKDMWGLSAIDNFIRSGNSVSFRFENGNSLALTPKNLDAFQSVWVPFRASFFPLAES
jgi:hypothetical protein